MTLDTSKAQTSQIEQITNPQPGERWGDITFTSLLREGMSANLYLVWHHRYWSVMVCKMLRAEEREDNRWRELLQVEGEVLKRLEHPIIVRLFELNMDAPLPYLLLEYLPGETVRQFLRRKGRFNLQDALRLTMYVGSALSYVHERGLIHRDVKPSNVMLNAGWVRLFDFGIVWPQGDEAPPDKSGTPMYLAPEQCRMEILTPATDIWALGIFLFELLTDQLPFPPGDYHNYEAPLEVRYPQLTTPPKTLQQTGLRVPAGLQLVLNRALAFDPAERYQKVEELLIALDPFCKTKIWPALPAADGRIPDLRTFLTSR
jgi:serine/threonine-protein kinase